MKQYYVLARSIAKRLQLDIQWVEKYTLRADSVGRFYALGVCATRTRE